MSSLVETKEQHMKPGSIVLNNGTSSAGKSTLARALQEAMDEPYLHTGIDHFFQWSTPYTTPEC